MDTIETENRILDPPDQNGTGVTEHDAAEAERQARLDACGKELVAVLEKHRCQIIPQISSEVEPVGRFGDCVQVRAVWKLAAMS